jgi:signal transduction histidine kinase
MCGAHQHFNFLRWFGGLSFIAIAAAAVITAATLSHFLATEVLHWDALITGEFIGTVAETQSYYGGYSRKTGVAELLGGIASAKELGVNDSVARASTAEFFSHIRALPNAAFINVYSLDRKIVWSYAIPEYEHRAREPEQQERKNLEDAFAYRDTGWYRTISRWDFGSTPWLEERSGGYYVENYVPLYDSQSRAVAVVEIYKEHAGLLDRIHRGEKLVWTTLLTAGALIYLALFWLALHASRVMADQHKRLVESRTQVVMDDMAVAVAHGIRSPLASIRSSAELILDEIPHGPKTHVRDIIEQTDRLSHWLRELLFFSWLPEASGEKVNIGSVLRESIENFSGRFLQNRIVVEWIEPEVDMPSVVGNRALLLQAFNSVISNAVEVMGHGGKLTVSQVPEKSQGRVTVSISDTGGGMTEKQLADAFKCFITTKPSGLGIGLAMVKRTLERYQGSVRIESRENVGTRVELSFSLAE